MGAVASNNYVVTTIYDIPHNVASIITTRYTSYLVVTSVITPVTTIYRDRGIIVTAVALSYFFAGNLVTVLDVPTNYTSIIGTITSVVQGAPITSIVTQHASGSGSPSGSGSSGGGAGTPGGGGNVHPMGFPRTAVAAVGSSARPRIQPRRRRIPV